VSYLVAKISEQYQRLPYLSDLSDHFGKFEWRIAIPEAIRVGHDAAFGAFTRRFLACVADPASLPARERPNLLAKYRVTTGAVAISRR